MLPGRLPPRATIVEVGPRDGLQNERARLAAKVRIGFVDHLSAAGLPVIEVGAFVSPAWVPQMAGTAEVLAGLTRARGVRYMALVPNMAGLDQAIEAGASAVAVFAAASETFSRRNINKGIDESFAVYREVCSRAIDGGMPVRGYLSTCFGCPYEGRVPVERVAELAERMAALGVYEVSLGDTIGVAHPRQVADVVEATARRVPVSALALHLHDTRGTALANALAGLQLGVATFDTSAGGLGGCPYAPGATGNLATEDLVYMLNGLGVATGVTLPAVVEASTFIEAHLDHRLPSRYLRAERARPNPPETPRD
jgi:hydroxymethylglutaryl-CoA lyase